MVSLTLVLLLVPSAFSSSGLDYEEHPDEKNETDKILQGDKHLPALSECGFEAVQDNRFVGGKVETIRQDPWVAALQIVGKSRGRGRRQVTGLRVDCLGTLISHKHVLTAAHCLYHDGSLLHPTNITVWLGRWELRRTTKADTANIKKYGVGTVNPYSSFDPNDKTRKHDIGLLETAVPVMYSDYIRPACLPRNKLRYEFIGTILRMNVWQDKRSGPHGKDLRWKIVVPIMDDLDCENEYKLQAGTLQRSHQFCVGGEDEEDSCQGNTGGALLDSVRLSDEKELWYVFGVASYGPQQCAIKERPATYTQVSIYIRWIAKEVENTFTKGEGWSRMSIKGYLYRRR